MGKSTVWDLRLRSKKAPPTETKSCHHCRTRKPDFLTCKCKLSYCDACLKNHYGGRDMTETASWICFRCKYSCVCSMCREATKEIQALQKEISELKAQATEEPEDDMSPSRLEAEIEKIKSAQLEAQVRLQTLEAQIVEKQKLDEMYKKTISDLRMKKKETENNYEFFGTS